jgi:hypothetical protein
MSEAELHLLRQRMYQGPLQQVRRGALNFALPLGYGHNAAGEVIHDPDAQVQHVVRLICRKCDERGTLPGL